MIMIKIEGFIDWFCKGQRFITRVTCSIHIQFFKSCLSSSTFFPNTRVTVARDNKIQIRN